MTHQFLVPGIRGKDFFTVYWVDKISSEIQLVFFCLKPDSRTYAVGIV